MFTINDQVDDNLNIMKCKDRLKSQSAMKQMSVDFDMQLLRF